MIPRSHDQVNPPLGGKCGAPKLILDPTLIRVSGHLVVRKLIKFIEVLRKLIGYAGISFARNIPTNIQACTHGE